jgi:hypothetical protein
VWSISSAARIDLAAETLKIPGFTSNGLFSGLIPESAMVLARTLADATGALHPDIPLPSNSPQFVDFSEVRGGETVGRLRRLFQRQRGVTFLHAVFASHRGAGKTTELLRLIGELQDTYICIYLEANVELDPVEFQLSDLLLVLAREVEVQMRRRGTPLPADALQQVENFFSEVVFTDNYGRSYVADIKSQARLSGGIRELMSLAQNATLDAAGEIITAADLQVTLTRQQHILRNKADYNGWWPALRQIASTKRLTDVPEQQTVVYQRLAFQYDGTIWYDVHPLLSDLPEIQTVLSGVSGTAGPAPAGTAAGGRL